MFFTVSIPLLPVCALAFPELTINALALPIFLIFLHHITGAEGARDFVTTHATFVSLVIEIKLKSNLSLYLIPECIEDNLIPLILGKLGNAFGARGDFFNILCKAIIFL